VNEYLFINGGFHAVFLDSEGKPMSSYEHRILTAALHLAEAEAMGNENDMAQAVATIVQNARLLLKERAQKDGDK
jgi:hypothetical protein